MPKHDPIEILLAHDQWATAQILNACANLTDAQFHQRFEMGLGSLHDTTTHIMGAMRTWTQTLASQELTPRLEKDGKRTVPQLLALLQTVAGELAAEAKRRPLSDTASRVRDGKSHTFTRGAILTHVATHGMHHRAQCLNMLRQLGVKPLPPSGVAEWSRMVDSAS